MGAPAGSYNGLVMEPFSRATMAAHLGAACCVVALEVANGLASLPEPICSVPEHVSQVLTGTVTASTLHISRGWEGISTS